MNRDACKIDCLLNCLTEPVRSRLLPHKPLLSRSATEIRLRACRPLTVSFPSEQLVLSSGGRLVSDSENAFILTEKMLNEVFQRLCEYSVYSKQNELVNGYITTQGGHRAGICGTAVYSHNEIINIKNISSINLRIARQLIGCASGLDSVVKTSSGLLLCGEPASGKTTVLRDLARMLSAEHKRNVSLLDERGELAASVSGIPQNDVGCCDVFDGFKKSDAMRLALRSMSPEYIVCDEIGGDSDVSSIMSLVNCGVRVIATAHAGNPNELMKKKSLSGLIKSGVFSHIVFLKSRREVGTVEKILEAGELIAA